MSVYPINLQASLRPLPCASPFAPLPRPAGPRVAWVQVSWGERGGGTPCRLVAPLGVGVGVERHLLAAERHSSWEERGPCLALLPLGPSARPPAFPGAGSLVPSRLHLRVSDHSSSCRMEGT